MSTTIQVTLTDTGKRRTSSGTAEESELANSGSTITLHCTEVIVNDEALLQANPVLSKYSTTGDATTRFTFGEVDQIGFGIPKWTLRGVIEFDKESTNLYVGKLRKLAQTKGYKQLSCDLGNLIDDVADSNFVNVRIRTVQMVHRAEHNVIEWQIIAFETA